MSGIGGIVYPDRNQNTNLIIPMLKTMKHRGPDSSDVMTLQNVQFGICGGSLSINSQKTIVSAMDGKITNFKEISKKLSEETSPKSFSSQEDLIIAAYEQWGELFVNHLDGDFSIALYDQREKKILLYRDRVGKKPLYWYRDAHLFIFGSELKAMMATGAIPQTPALDAYSSYLFFGYIPQDMSPIKDVSKLLPGHYLRYENSYSLNISSYWSYSSYFERQQPVEKAHAIEHLNELLLISTQRRIPKKEPYGCLVQGGLGSASIAYYVQKNVHRDQIPAFTVTYKGANDEDLTSAYAVAETLKLTHYHEVITPSHFLDNIVPIVWYLDEPLADPNIAATWKLAALAKQHVNVVFSGMGSDELLAAHSRYQFEKPHGTIMSLLSKLPSGILQSLFFPLFNKIYPPLSFLLLKLSLTNSSQFDFISQNALFDEGLLKKVSPKLAKFFDPEIFLHKFHHLSRIKSTIPSFIYFDVKTRLPDFYLLQLERITAAHSLDWRTPYLDRSIVEYLATVAEPEPSAYLKSALKNVFPAYFLKRPKQWRPHFLYQWVDKSELSTIFPLLQRGTLVESGLVSEQWLKENTRSIQTQKAAFPYLWGLLILEIWSRLYVNRPISESAPKIRLRELLEET